jgi:primase-polymerase (primpol)-like protein
MSRFCEHCGGLLPTVARRDARFCRGACRVAAHRAGGLPRELTSLPRWVRHSATKVPLTTGGRTASATDPGTWSDYAAARRSRAGYGIGFVLAGDGILCLDLDHSLNTSGEPLPDVARLLATIPPTYIEVSPSGTGLHVWGRGHLAHGRRTRVRGVQVEAYGTGRYITVTGRRLGSAPTILADLTATLHHLLDRAEPQRA